MRHRRRRRLRAWHVWSVVATLLSGGGIEAGLKWWEHLEIDARVLAGCNQRIFDAQVRVCREAGGRWWKTSCVIRGR